MPGKRRQPFLPDDEHEVTFYEREKGRLREVVAAARGVAMRDRTPAAWAAYERAATISSIADHQLKIVRGRAYARRRLHTVKEHPTQPEEASS